MVGTKKKNNKEVPNCVPVKEDEQIDELSKSTLGSYIKRASKDTAVHGFAIGDSIANKKWSTGAKAGDMAKKRIKGIGAATDRLTKEENEIVPEKESRKKSIVRGAIKSARDKQKNKMNDKFEANPELSSQIVSDR